MTFIDTSAGVFEKKRQFDAQHDENIEISIMNLNIDEHCEK
jgi:hypothetical protein